MTIYDNTFIFQPLMQGSCVKCKFFSIEMMQCCGRAEKFSRHIILFNEMLYNSECKMFQALKLETIYKFPRNSFNDTRLFIHHSALKPHIWKILFCQTLQLGAFPVTREAIQPRPSYNPSPLRAQQAWMCQSWFLMLWRDRVSVISAGVMASLRSCLFAKTSTTECWRSSCPSNLKSSSFIMEILALSVLSITAMIAWVPR